MSRSPTGSQGAKKTVNKWRTAKAGNGKTYYYHTETKATSWDMPEEFRMAMLEDEYGVGNVPQAAKAPQKKAPPKRVVRQRLEPGAKVKIKAGVRGYASQLGELEKYLPAK